jgi:RHS repeat-associated protein
MLSNRRTPPSTTERFRYDPVERLTCAYFDTVEDDSAPCALSYAYDPTGNGNLTTKSDVGTLLYGDSKHPHAVTTAGTDTFGYDPIGNQTQRPGATIAYAPFDLPKTITQSAGSITFAYDGDESRIRKTTPTEETLYFGDLYQRDTLSSAPSAHRYYVRSPERVVAVVTVGGTTPGTLYVHVDHLGSVDVLTDASGNVVEHRSYDPFGARRNPVWGQQPPASFPSLTTVGYTGQEADNELGLVNMKGRVYDPKVGRFLTIDPLVADPLSAQSWNAYAYVENNPLNFVDPTGFEYTPPPVDPEYAKDPTVQRIQAAECAGLSGLECSKGPPVRTVEGPREATQVGATRPPVDVSTTGSASGNAPQPAAVIADAARGFAVGVYRTYSPNVIGYLKAVTGITLADNAIKGARDDGAIGFVAGAVNTINPFFHWGVGVVDAQQRSAAGDTAGAVEAGTGVALGVATAVLGGVLGAAGAGPNRATVTNGRGALDGLRGELGLAPGEGTLTRLDVGGQTFYGISGHGQQFARPSGVNFQSLRHAEGDVFGQAARAGVSGGDAILYVDRSVCVFCQSSLQGYIRALGLDSLMIVEPGTEPYTVHPR